MSIWRHTTVYFLRYALLIILNGEWSVFYLETLENLNAFLLSMYYIFSKKKKENSAKMIATAGTAKRCEVRCLEIVQSINNYSFQDFQHSEHDEKWRNIR